MKIELKWKSDKDMRALFSNIGTDDNNSFLLLIVYHKSKKGGFSRDISIEECNQILKKENLAYNLSK